MVGARRSERRANSSSWPTTTSGQSGTAGHTKPGAAGHAKSGAADHAKSCATDHAESRSADYSKSGAANHSKSGSTDHAESAGHCESDRCADDHANADCFADTDADTVPNRVTYTDNNALLTIRLSKALSVAREGCCRPRSRE